MLVRGVKEVELKLNVRLILNGGLDAIQEPTRQLRRHWGSLALLGCPSGT